jgi:hypothetical protein
MAKFILGLVFYTKYLLNKDSFLIVVNLKSVS